MSTIYILWLRQIKRYYRSKSRMIGSLSQPLLFLVSLSFGFGSTFQKAGQGDYTEFLAPGIVAMSIIFSAIFFGIEIIWDRQFGFLKETLVAPVSRLEIMVGRTLGGATVATCQGIIVFFISMLIGFRIDNWSAFLPAVFVMFLIATLFTALGTMIASFMEDMHGFQLIMNFLVMPLFFLSGALFPIEGLPKGGAVLVACDPLSYGVDALRSLLTGVSHYGLGLDLVVLTLTTIIFLILGGYFFSKIEV
jgi:ABC-2 type transport system permease protein